MSAVPSTLSAPRSWRTTLPLLAIPSLVLIAAPSAVLLAARTQPGLPDRAVLLVALLPLLTPLLMRVLRRPWDPLLLSPVWMLCAMGLAVIARVQPRLLNVQILWITLGWAVFIALVGFPPLLSWLRRFRTLWLVLAIAMVFSTLFLAQDVNGSGTRIWLRLGPVSMQPGEVLRIALIAFTATYLSERGHLLTGRRRGATGGTWREAIPPRAYWLPLLGMLALSLVAVAAQRDFGPAILFVAAFLGMLYIATGRRDGIVVA
ncbi:MAG: FtsW/RodA/SpoVE family cell cycle protein, partial [Chloroflexota bacterium]